jgi:putative ABC transport system substrate-binding protein
MTRRRTLIGGLAGGLLPWVGRSAPGQTPRKVYRIGWLSATPYAGSSAQEPFVDGMRERGWVAGSHFTVENLHSEGRNERLPALAAELVRLKVDLIICAGSPATAAAKNASATIPIVFFFVADPVASGFVASLARPGGNITGLGGLALGAQSKYLELLREVAPKASRIAMFVNPELHAQLRAEIGPAAQRLGITLRAIELRSPSEIDAAFAAAARERVDALLIFGQPSLYGHTARVARMAIERHLPTVTPLEEATRDGGLMSYGSRIIDDVRRLPYYVDRILAGASPSELPVEQPTRFYLTINLRTARTLGLMVPQALLLRADEVIE